MVRACEGATRALRRLSDSGCVSEPTSPALRPSCFNRRGQEPRLPLSSPITPSATLAHSLSLSINDWPQLPQICLLLALCVAKESHGVKITLYVSVVEAWSLCVLSSHIKNTWHVYPKACCLPVDKMSLAVSEGSSLY